MAIELLDEHEQGEVVRNWLKQYGGALFGGAVLGIGMIFGVHQWREHGVQQRAQASTQYQVLVDAYESRDLDLAERLSAELRHKRANTPYAALAALRDADEALKAGDLERAAASLRWVIGNSRDPAMRDLANLRLARVLLAAGDPEAALAAAGAVAQGSFAALVAEVRGDALLALGRRAEAVDAYRAGLAGGAGTARGEVLRLKLEDLADVGGADA
jgi:predicted negative regulator of RcsB-dependent stress response